MEYSLRESAPESPFPNFRHLPIPERQHETVPENTVRFQITYNEQAVSPYLRDSEQESEDPFVGIEFAYLQNDMELFLAGKEQLLDDIKNRRIGSYETVSVERIRIFVNPASADLVIMD